MVSIIFRGKLDSQYLESFMTASGSFSARIPYQGSVLVDPSKYILFISSNGFEATKDLTNRASIIRIRKREGHNYKTLNRKDVLQLTFEWQPILMGCVFSVVEEWFNRGKPHTSETRHDFREWCEVLDWIVQTIFYAAPLMDGHQEAKERASSPQLTFLRSVAVELNQLQKLNVPVSATDIADLAIESDMEIPGIEVQTVEAGRKQIGVIMGRMFKDRDEVTFDEFQVTKREENVQSSAGNTQRVNRYTFSLIRSSTPQTPSPHQPPPQPPAP